MTTIAWKAELAITNLKSLIFSRRKVVARMLIGIMRAIPTNAHVDRPVENVSGKVGNNPTEGHEIKYRGRINHLILWEK